MGGLPCAKAIIDQGNATVQVLGCMNASILLSAPNGTTPTEQMEDEFIAAAQKLADIAGRIEKSMRTGEAWEEYEDSTGGDGKGKPEDKEP